MTLQFYQIYFQDEQKDKLYPFAIPYKNEKFSLLFENDVIKDLVPQSQADLISVCSWRLAQKRGEGASEAILKRNGSFSLTEERILSSDFDIAILTPRNHKDIVEKLILWHGPVAREALDVLNTFIRIPNVVEHAIYENHFIARKEIYQEYVRSTLAPAIQFMEGRWDVFGKDSGYITKKKDQKEIEAYQKTSGRKDWPIAPFILERLFCIWANKKGFKYINL